MTQMISLNDNKLTEDENKRNELILLITNASFNEYIIRTIERKLKSIPNTHHFIDGQENFIYETTDDFENLLAIWKYVL